MASPILPVTPRGLEPLPEHINYPHRLIIGQTVLQQGLASRH